MDIRNELIKIDKKNGIGVVALNRHEAMNALNTGMLHELGDTIARLESDEGIKAVIVTGVKNFCAGADVKELKEKHPREAEVFSRLGHNVFNRIEIMGKPVIAAVNGYALGAGCELALACDLRIAGESAKFGTPEVNLGLIPGFGGTQRLTRLVGIGKAKEMILTGKIIDAKEAESIGLVNRVVKDEELMDKAWEIAQVLAQKSPIAVRFAKNLINSNQEMKRRLDMEIISFSECFASEDHMEGINAFLEKRKPRFRGI